jgi:hypothetical protein
VTSSDETVVALLQAILEELRAIRASVDALRAARPVPEPAPAEPARAEPARAEPVREPSPFQPSTTLLEAQALIRQSAEELRQMMAELEAEDPDKDPPTPHA